MSHIIRLAGINDSSAILDIYAPYITDTTISFETEVPAAGDFADRVKSIIKQYPFLLYVIDGNVVGYAYASRHKERAAYLYDVDVSIYILPEYHSRGIAGNLYGCLFDILKLLGYRNVYAGYTVPNDKSMRLHYKFDFSLVGTYHKAGYKFRKWHDVTWLEKTINEYDEIPAALKSIYDLPREELDKIFMMYLNE